MKLDILEQIGYRGKGSLTAKRFEAALNYLYDTTGDIETLNKVFKICAQLPSSMLSSIFRTTTNKRIRSTIEDTTWLVSRGIDEKSDSDYLTISKKVESQLKPVEVMQDEDVEFVDFEDGDNVYKDARMDSPVVSTFSIHFNNFDYDKLDYLDYRRLMYLSETMNLERIETKNEITLQNPSYDVEYKVFKYTDKKIELTKSSIKNDIEKGIFKFENVKPINLEKA